MGNHHSCLYPWWEVWCMFFNAGDKSCLYLRDICASLSFYKIWYKKKLIAHTFFKNVQVVSKGHITMSKYTPECAVSTHGCLAIVCVFCMSTLLDFLKWCVSINQSYLYATLQQKVKFIFTSFIGQLKFLLMNFSLPWKNAIWFPSSTVVPNHFSSRTHFLKR